MNIGPLRSANAKNSDIQRINQDAEKTSPQSENITAAEGTVGDKVFISNIARDLHHTDKAVRNALKKVPDFRPEKVNAAVERIKNGHYFEDEAMDKTAESLLKGMLASDRAEKRLMERLFEKTNEIPDIREREVAVAKEKKAEKFYHEDEPIHRVAEKIWIPSIERLE